MPSSLRWPCSMKCQQGRWLPEGMTKDNTEKQSTQNPVQGRLQSGLDAADFSTDTHEGPLLSSGLSPGAEATGCVFGWSECSSAGWARGSLFVPIDCSFFPPERQRHQLGLAPHSWSRVDAPSAQGESVVTPVTPLGTAPQRCSCQAGWGSHRIGFAAPAVHLLGTADNIPHFGFIPKNREEDLLDPGCPCARGGQGVGAGTARPGAVLSRELSQRRVRLRMKARTQLHASGKEDGFAEAASPSAGKSKQRQQSRWSRRKLERKRGN